MKKSYVIIGIVIAFFAIPFGAKLLGIQFPPCLVNCAPDTVVTPPIITITPTPSPLASPSANLANPASVNCTKMGGDLLLRKKDNGAAYGLCYFEDDMACEEWALFRGECPKGGVKTTGFDTIEEKYCAWIGGKTTATKNASCTLPSGKVCTAIAVYNDKCQ